MYLRPGRGVGGLSKAFGTKARRGTMTNTHKPAATGIIRHVLQQLEALKVMNETIIDSLDRVSAQGFRQTFVGKAVVYVLGWQAFNKSKVRLFQKQEIAISERLLSKCSVRCFYILGGSV